MGSKRRNKYNWNEVSTNCRNLNIEAKNLVNKSLNKRSISEDEFIGQMTAIKINCKDPIKLMETLYIDFKLIVPIVKWENDMLLRFSIQAYNSMEDIEKLIFAIKKLKL